MTFPLNNPDVDPLSQNQRLNTLETFPPGGGGAGGGSPYQVPDFDLYPDNTIKVYPDVGLVGKISIPDSAQMFPGVDLKYCWYIPLVNGVPLGKKFFVMRQHNPNPWTFSSSITTNPIHKYFHCDFEKFAKDYFAITGPFSVYNISFTTQVTFKIGTANYFIEPSFSVGGQIAQPSWPDNSVVTLQARITSSLPSGTRPPASFTLSAGYRFAFYISDNRSLVTIALGEGVPNRGFAPSTPGGPILNPSLAVTSLQDIPTVYKAFYPKSWTT